MPGERHAGVGHGLNTVQLWLRLLAGLVLSSAIGLLAYRRGSLSSSGVAGAVVVGSGVFGLGGWVWGGLLILFFASSSLLSRYRARDKSGVAQQYAKGGRRDVWQVLANGGVPTVLAAAHYLWGLPVFWGAVAGALAAVTADTWATEIGVLANKRPRLVTTWTSVPPGTSGGVSFLGTMATLAGSTGIGLCGAAFLAVSRLFEAGEATGPSPWSLMLPAVVGGMAGAFGDSLMGATIQAVYYSRDRHKETEKQREPDGTLNRHLRGWRWVTNDVVNLCAALSGALVGGLLFALLG